jgi:soluble lytic murein transglycosylase-like protein
VWSNQKAAFKMAARRFNKKLNDSQATEIAQALVDAGRAHGMDPRFLASIVAVESSFDIYCLSRSGAMGLGQIMPFNLKEAGITNAWNPRQNIFGAARLLRGHLNSFGSRPDGTLLAVAAYNAGPNAVRRAGYKVPNGAQVQRYVWKVYYQYKAFAPDLFR